jgi:dipeptide/tripeptide permease
MKEFNTTTAHIETIEKVETKQPKQLYLLFFTEMWERFSFYGMKALLPVKIVGMMMGIWFLASAIGEFLAGKIGALMSVPEDIVDKPAMSLPYYADILIKIGLALLF